METIMAIRNTAFWWIGCWAIITIGNAAIKRFFLWREERRSREAKKALMLFMAAHMTQGTMPHKATLYDQDKEPGWARPGGEEE